MHVGYCSIVLALLVLVVASRVRVTCIGVLESEDGYLSRSYSSITRVVHGIVADYEGAFTPHHIDMMTATKLNIEEKGAFSALL
jgi:hypothetical protein